MIIKIKADGKGTVSYEYQSNEHDFKFIRFKIIQWVL